MKNEIKKKESKPVEGNFSQFFPLFISQKASAAMWSRSVCWYARVKFKLKMSKKKANFGGIPKKHKNFSFYFVDEISLFPPQTSTPTPSFCFVSFSLISIFSSSFSFCFHMSESKIFLDYRAVVGGWERWKKIGKSDWISLLFSIFNGSDQDKRSEWEG